MKLPKFTAFVLSLHAAVVGLLLLQPGCNTQEPLPPQEPTFASTGLRHSSASEASELDAFNANLHTAAVDRSFSGALADRPRLAPQRPQPPQIEEYNALTASNTSYTIQKGDTLWLIAKKFEVPLNELIQKNNLDKNASLVVGKKLQIPTDLSLSTTLLEGSEPQTSQKHKVTAGDSLSTIAHRYKTTVQAIKAANHLTSNVILVGQTLKIPATGSSNSTPKAAYSKKAPSGNQHIVQAGETVSDIAKLYRTTTAELMRINEISDPRKLKIGQALNIKRSEDVNTSTQSAAKVARTSTNEPVLITKNHSKSHATLNYFHSSQDLKEEDSSLFEVDHAIPVVSVHKTE